MKPQKNQEPELKKAVIYARYSSHSQTEQSIEGQLRDNYAWAKQNNVLVVGEYIDRALSGTKDARPDFQRMIEDSAKHQFELVIVWKLDRFARNRYDSATYKARLKKNGVRVISVKESITDNPEGIILEGLLESMAEYYSANLSQNIRRGLRESAAKGNFCGGPIPYGYKVENKKLVPDEKTAPIVRYLFEEYAKGTDKKDIIETLTARGVRNRYGNPLVFSSFQKVLRSTTYIGEHVYRGEILQGCATPLISRATFDKVQTMLDRHAQAPASVKARVPYALQGKAFCGICGATLVGESGRSQAGSVFSYYSCGNRKKRHTCCKKPERRESLETFVVRNTLEYILTPARMAQIARAVVAEYDKTFSSSIVDELEKALVQVDRELGRLVDALLDAPKVAHGKIYERMEALEEKKSALEVDIAKNKIALNLRFSEEEVISWLYTFKNGDPDDPAFRARLIDNFVNSVYSDEEKTVIFYNIRETEQVTFPAYASALKPESSQSSDLKCHAGLTTFTARANSPEGIEKSEPSKSSDLECYRGAFHFKSEPNAHYYVFVRGVFGIVFFKNDD